MTLSIGSASLSSCFSSSPLWFGFTSRVEAKSWQQVNVWAESHPEAGAVCVGADHREAVSRQVASTHRKGNEAGEVPGHKVLQREDGKQI